ncbi:MAG: Gfo/Idh/MocA family oxidoreductase [bacterium]|nr:Gfo/Idh/MocA family oxidoreductase [bacterium]
MNEVRIGIIGMGNIGNFHANHFFKGLIKRARLTAVADVRPAALERYRNDYKTFDSSGALIRSGEVDAVIIGTPHYDHTAIGIDALEQGLHVMVEKPISVHKADCERLIAAHRGREAQVFTADFQMRTSPTYQRIKRLIDGGELGEIRRVNWIITCWFRSNAYYASSEWRATWGGEGGGVLLNQCPHNLDLMQFFFGLPSRVRGFCNWGKYHPIEVEDEVTAYLEYPNGATGVFITTTGEAPGSDRLEIAGDQGKLILENGARTFTRNEIPSGKFCRETRDLFGVPPVWNVQIPVPTGGISHPAMIQNFVNAILDGEPLIVRAEEGIRSIELANAILYSAWTGATVDLPLDGAAYEAALKQKIAGSTFSKTVAQATAGDMEKSFH